MSEVVTKRSIPYEKQREVVCWNQILRGMFPAQHFPDLKADSVLEIEAKTLLDKLKLAYDLGYGEGLSKGVPDKAFHMYRGNQGERE